MPADLMPIAPFRTWLERQRRDCEDSNAILADRLGVDQRRVRNWMHSQTFVTLGCADQAICNAGDHLSEVYPELYGGVAA